MSRPRCFGNPDHVAACNRCGVRFECWSRYHDQNDRPVALLPAAVPARRDESREGSHHVEVRPCQG